MTYATINGTTVPVWRVSSSRGPAPEVKATVSDLMFEVEKARKSGLLKYPAQNVKVCECGKKFDGGTLTPRYKCHKCEEKDEAAYNLAHPPKKQPYKYKKIEPTLEMFCVICDTRFMAHRTDRKTCSKDCRDKNIWNKKREKRPNRNRK